jgi:hypothetical protein
MKTKKHPENTLRAERLVNGPNAKPAHEEVALCAYYIWEQQGRTDGHDVEDWQEAERQLEATCAQK